MKIRIIIIAVIIWFSISGCGAKDTAQGRELVKIRTIEKGDKIQDGKLCLFSLERRENTGRETISASGRGVRD